VISTKPATFDVGDLGGILGGDGEVVSDGNVS